MTLTPDIPTDDALLLCRSAAFRDSIWRHCPDLHERAKLDALSTVIHPADQMLLHSLRHHRDANAACSQYFNVALQQYHCVRQLMDMAFPEPEADFRFLDFACGYGRLLRFLSLRLGGEQLWASEIQDDAIEFVAGQFGVRTLASHADPTAFDPPCRFDMIWVASLFSHLPDRLFRAWIKRLLECLTPNGILCFSTHDQCLLAQGTPMPDDGIVYIPSSENADLNTDVYGTTFVSREYVERAIAEASDGLAKSTRLARALAHEQDIYVVTPSDARDHKTFEAFRRGPWGWVDAAEIDEHGMLRMRGWAASIDDGPLDEIELRIDGQHFRVPTGSPRPDVAAAFDDPRLEHCGWSFEHGPIEGRITFEASAPTIQGERALLRAGKMTAPARTQAPAGKPGFSQALARLFGLSRD